MVDVRLVLHVRGIDTPTLSPKCSQPSHQSVKNPPIRIVDDVSGPFDGELTAPCFADDERRVGGLLTLSREGHAALSSLKPVPNRIEGAVRGIDP